MTTHCNLPVGAANIYLGCIFYMIWYAWPDGDTWKSLLRPNPSSKGGLTWGSNFKTAIAFYLSFVENRRELSARKAILKCSQRKETKATPLRIGEAIVVLAEIWKLVMMGIL